MTQAYTGVDISMEDVMQEIYIYHKDIIAFSGVAIIIINIILWLAREYVTMPVNRMTVAMHGITRTGTAAERENGSAELRAIEIHTGDEIENLHTALSRRRMTFHSILMLSISKWRKMKRRFDD